MCSGFSDVPVVVLEKGNDLWNCLFNWCSKLSLRLISEWPDNCFMKILHCSDSFNSAFALAHCVYVLLCWRRATICGIASLICPWNWAFELISAWPYWWMVEISHCSDSFDNAFAPAPWVTPSSCFRRAMICGMAFPIGPQNSASNGYQHSLSGRLLRSHIVQTVSTMHLYQHLWWLHHHVLGEQWSVAWPP